jgi:elongation factor G
VVPEQLREGALWPLLNVTIDPKSAADSANLHCAIGRLSTEDPALSFHDDTETGQTIMGGTSEAQLEANIAVLRSIYDVKANFGRIQIAYLETIGSKTEMKYTHKKQAGGSGQYAEVKISFEPIGQNAGIVFENELLAGAVPPKYVPAVEKAIRLQAQSGVLAGFPTVDFKFTLIDCKYHDVDSSEVAFEIAAKACFRELRKTGSVRLLEPIMKVAILTPSGYADEIISDLRKRSGGVVTIEARGGTEVVTGFVPLAAMFGYARALSDLSRGRAEFSMQYERYQEVALPEPPDDRFPPAMAIRA